MKQRLVIYTVVLAGVLGWMAWRTQAPAPIEVEIVQAGEIRVGDQPVALEALGAHVARALERDPRRPVRLAVAARSPSTVLIPVLDALERSGVEDVQVVANP